MAFWKREKDPWDIDPEKRKKSKQPEPEKTPPPWVPVREKSAPMLCPRCGGEMIWGNLFVNGRTCGMVWEEGEQKSFLESFGTDQQTKTVQLGLCEEAWYCSDCRKLTLDVNVPMGRSGPNYIWKDGKIVFSQEKKEREDDL